MKNTKLLFQYITVGAVIVGGTAIGSAFLSYMRRKKHEEEIAKGITEKMSGFVRVADQYAQSGIESPYVNIWHAASGSQICDQDADCGEGERCYKGECIPVPTGRFKR